MWYCLTNIFWTVSSLPAHYLKHSRCIFCLCFYATYRWCLFKGHCQLSTLSTAWCRKKVKVKSLSRVRLLGPHGLQPTRLLHPWDFPGKSTGVGARKRLQMEDHAYLCSDKKFVCLYDIMCNFKHEVELNVLCNIL